MAPLSKPKPGTLLDYSILILHPPVVLSWAKRVHAKAPIS